MEYEDEENFTLDMIMREPQYKINVSNIQKESAIDNKHKQLINEKSKTLFSNGRRLKNKKKKLILKKKKESII